MIEHLYIKNVAIIDEISIDFSEGLNILSGETGAGKSIIIDAVNFVTGGKPSRDFIHKASDLAEVEALFSINGRELEDYAAQLGLEIGEDSCLLITRTLNSAGKSRVKINGRPATVSMLRELSSQMIDIHGQHEHQSLLNPAKHIILLDRFCTAELACLKDELAVYLKQYRETTKALDGLDIDSEERNSKLQLYLYQLNEIKDANLREGEEEELTKKRKKLLNAEKLRTLSNAALEFLYRSEEMSAYDRISGALNNLYDISAVDNAQKKLYDELEDVSARLEAVIDNLRKYNESIEIDTAKIDEIEKRLDLIYNLKRKYGSTIQTIISYYNSTLKKYKLLLNSSQKIEQLLKQKNELNKNLRQICEKISILRKIAAEKLEISIENSLKSLGMKNAVFKINLEQNSLYSNDGWDKVEFMISANKGENIKPLAKIASGGEMSRVMLSLKVVLADADSIETFIFDEIDTGVSGRTAQKVAEKLSELAAKRQILCITHLPQIAAMGTANFLIEKKTTNEKTNTIVSRLENKEVINEIARLISGAEITSASLQAAEEMRMLAKKVATT